MLAFFLFGVKRKFRTLKLNIPNTKNSFRCFLLEGNSVDSVVIGERITIWHWVGGILCWK